MSISQIEQILSEVPIFPERIKTPYDEYVPQGHALFDFFHTTMQPEYNLLRKQYNSLSVSINASALLVDSHYNNVVDMASTVQKLRDETVIANNEIKNYVVPTEAVDSQDLRDIKDKNILNSVFNAYGYTKDVGKSRWLETDIPNTIVDSVSEPIRFSKGLVEREADSKVVLPNAPFADSTDKLLSYQTATDGIKTAIAHEAGDIVHIGDGGNLFDYGTFDGNNDNGWDITDDGVDITNERIEISPPEDGYQSAYSTFNLNKGTAYRMNITIGSSAGTIDNTYIYLGTGIGYSDILNNSSEGSIGDRFFIFNTPNGIGDITIHITVRGYVSSKTVTYDNISVIPIEQTYQAIGTVPTETALNDTSKFNKVDFISRQDPILLCEDGKYRTFKGYKNFEAGFSVDDVAIGYGFSKLDKGLFSVTDLDCVNDAGDPDNYTGEVIIVGVQQRLNAGAYHLFFNSFGCAETARIDTPTSNSSRRWYDTDSYKTSSLYEVFIGCEYNDAVVTCRRDSNSVPTGSLEVSYLDARPDLKRYDKVYKNSDGGMIFRNQLAVKHSLTDLLNSKTNELIGLSDTSEEMGAVFTSRPEAPYNKTLLEYLEDGTAIKHSQMLTQGVN